MGQRDSRFGVKHRMCSTRMSEERTRKVEELLARLVARARLAEDDPGHQDCCPPDATSPPSPQSDPEV